MRTRRAVLSVIGMAAFAGCSSQATDTTDQAAERELSIAFDGLGRYEEKVRNAEPLEEASLEVTTDDIHQMLEETDSAMEEATQIAYFAETVNPEDLHSILQEYHLEKTSTENQVAVNQNTHIGGRIGNVNEIYTVKNGNLQSQPILQTDLLVKTEKGDTIHKPGQQTPQELKRQRDDSDFSISIPQDYDALQAGLEAYDQTKEEMREGRAGVFNRWSAGLFGIGESMNIVPYDGKTSNMVFDALYNNGDTEAIVELNQQFAASEYLGSDELVSARYDGSEWQFETHPDYALEEGLPGEQ